MPKEIKEINLQAEQMKAFVEGIPGGGMPGMQGVPTGPSGGGAPAGPGNGAMQMPSEADMQAMMQSMMQQGIDPTSMDSNQFAQMMMANQMGMGQNQPPTGPQAGFGGGGGGFDQGGGFDGPPRGRGRGRRGRGW